MLIRRVASAIGDHTSDSDRRVGLCLVRLDRLGEINHSLGYESAELLLDEFAARVRAFARSRDEIIEVKRNKLCVVFKGFADENHAQLAAAKLERMFAQPLDVIDVRLKVKIHAGFVVGDTADVRELLQRAELALQRSRETDTPVVIVSGQTLAEAGNDWSFERELAAAVQNSELLLHFQPKVSAAFGTVLGAEALMRWHSPAGGFVSPAKFILVAERCGLINDLTWFAVKSAVAQCAQWPSDLSVAVNISAVLLGDRALVDVVGDSLSIFGLQPERLVLEVTETGFMKNQVKAFELLTTLRGRGVRVSIDDFGTGYSSLAYFRDIPADEIKIDRSFVSRMLDHKVDCDIVKTIVDLGHRFSLTVVAEGVEDEPTAQRLRELGCDVIQGYWAGKPMSGADYAAWLTREVGATRSATRT